MSKMKDLVIDHQNKYEEIKHYIKDLERDIEDNIYSMEENMKDLIKIASSTQTSMNLHLSTIKYSFKRIEELKKDLESWSNGFGY